MSTIDVKCRRGDAFAFTLRLTARWPGGIPAGYTQCVFQIRSDGKESLPALLSIDTTNGITIDHAQSLIVVAVGASQTSGLPSVGSSKAVFGQVRLYHATDPNDIVSWVIPRLLIIPNGVPL